MKKISALALCASLCVLSAAAATEKTKSKSNEAWWLGAWFQASASKALGIPAVELAPGIEKVALLTKEKVAKFPDVKKDLAKNHLNFELQLAPGGVKHKAVVGVYSSSGGGGRFLLIAKPKGKSWEKVFFQAERGQPGFSALQKLDDGVLWCTCMYCDGCTKLSWNEKTGYYLEDRED